MKIISIAVGVVMAVLSPLTYADEVVLKDGTKIQFIVMRDKGENCDLETPEGGKLQVKKSDILKVSLLQPSPAALTGATFSFDKKSKIETVDLIPQLNPKNAIAGTWKSSGKAIVTPAIPHARILFPVTVPDEYDVQVVAQRDSGNGAFYLFLPTPKESRIMVALDGTGGIEGGVSGAPETVYNEKAFRDTKPHTLLYQVRKNRFILFLDGKKMIDWVNPDYPSATIPESVNISAKGIVLGDFDTSYTVTKLSVVYPQQ